MAKCYTLPGSRECTSLRGGGSAISCKIRVAALLLSVCALLLLGACQASQNEKKTQKEAEYPKVVIVSSGSYGEDTSFAKVKDAVNEITKKKLGIEVEFRDIGGNSYSEQVELLLTGGEQVDILWGSNALFVKAYMNRQLCDLEDLLKEYGKDIVKAVGWKYINCCRIGGTLYGLPNNRDYAAGWDSYALRKDLLDKYDIEAEDIKTIEDLEGVFDLILEKEDIVPLACNGSLFGNFALADGINSFPAGGHENYGKEEAIVNIFETEEYEQRLKLVRKWYLRGYLGDNILENTSTVAAMIKNGEAFAVPVKNKPGMKTQESLKCGREMEIVQLGKTAISYNSMAAFPWMIPKNTASKENAMKVLNLFYSDTDIMNLLAYGIEGEDYVETADGHITLPEGKTENPYYGMAWRLPNQFILKVWEGDSLSLWEQMRTWNEEALQSSEIGFNFNVFPVAKQYLALEEIYAAYKPILESGIVNPEMGLAQMLEELKENGLDEVIAEKEKQFKKWKREQN